MRSKRVAGRIRFAFGLINQRINAVKYTFACKILYLLTHGGQAPSS